MIHSPRTSTFRLDTDVTPMPYELEKGAVIRGNIPLFNERSKRDDVVQLRTIYGIGRIILLCPDTECQRISNVNLKQLYKGKGFQVTHFPINNNHLPAPEELNQLINRIQGYLLTGETLFIHCNAGRGRTGMVLACLARRVFGFTGNEAIRWIRSHIDESLTSSKQRQLVRDIIPLSYPESDLEFLKPSKVTSDEKPSKSILMVEDEEKLSLDTVVEKHPLKNFTLNAEITPMPYPLKKGSVIRGNMPYVTEYSKSKISQYRSVYGINRIVLLLTDRECNRSGNLNLKSLYSEAGYKVTHFPIVDYQIPKMRELRLLVDGILANLSNDENILVHCMAGHGRTGLILACLARKTFDFSGNEAIRWVRSKVDGALKSANQRQMVRDFIPDSLEVSDVEFQPVVSTAYDMSYGHMTLTTGLSSSEEEMQSPVTDRPEKKSSKPLPTLTITPNQSKGTKQAKGSSPKCFPPCNLL